jgi:hypothetical protein
LEASAAAPGWVFPSLFLLPFLHSLQQSFWVNSITSPRDPFSEMVVCWAMHSCCHFGIGKEHAGVGLWFFWKCPYQFLPGDGNANTDPSINNAVKQFVSEAHLPSPIFAQPLTRLIRIIPEFMPSCQFKKPPKK